MTIEKLQTPIRTDDLVSAGKMMEKNAGENDRCRSVLK